MRQKCVAQILRPLKTGIQAHPVVTVSDKVTHAIEVMVTNNINQIVVTHHDRAIGMVRLDDAFKMLGLGSASSIKQSM